MGSPPLGSRHSWLQGAMEAKQSLAVSLLCFLRWFPEQKKIRIPGKNGNERYPKRPGLSLAKETESSNCLRTFWSSVPTQFAGMTLILQVTLVRKGNRSKAQVLLSTWASVFQGPLDFQRSRSIYRWCPLKRLPLKGKWLGNPVFTSRVDGPKQVAKLVVGHQNGPNPKK